jgi:hypothetical protein
MDLFPDYKGDLSPAPWSGFRITPEITDNLKQAALKGCPSCKSAGYVGAGEVVQLCHCVHRREEGRWKPGIR